MPWIRVQFQGYSPACSFFGCVLSKGCSSLTGFFWSLPNHFSQIWVRLVHPNTSHPITQAVTLVQLAAKGSCNPTQPPPQRHPVGDSAFPRIRVPPLLLAWVPSRALRGELRWWWYLASLSHRIPWEWSIYPSKIEWEPYQRTPK